MPPLPSTTSNRPTERSTGVVGPQRTEPQYPAGRWQPPPAATRTAPAAAAGAGAGRRQVWAGLAAVLAPLPTCSQTRTAIAAGWAALPVATATAGQLSTTVAVVRDGQGRAGPPTLPIVQRLPNPISGICDRLAAVRVGAVACAGAAGAAVAAVAAGPPRPPRGHGDVLAPAGENDNYCLLTERAVHKVAFLECNFAMRAVDKTAGQDCNFAVYCGSFECDMKNRREFHSSRENWRELCLRQHKLGNFLPLSHA